MSDEAVEKKSFLNQIKGLPGNFWCANSMEILERLAFFSVRAIAPLYLVKTANEHGLGLSYTDKGTIYMIWALIQCLVPMFSGGYTEHYGYRKSLFTAFVINITGYLLMAQSLPISEHFAAQGHDSAGFWIFLLAASLVGFGTAIFKPPCQGTIAKCTDDQSSSMGWGIFYWMVNIGGAVAPMFAATLRGETNWSYVFYAAAIVTAVNFLPAIFWFKEPEKEKPAAPAEGLEESKADDEPHGVFGVFVHSIRTLFTDMRLVMFLVIFSCFWLMFMQLFDLVPNFIDEWVDTTDVAGIFGWFKSDWVLSSGQVKPEMVINIDAISIILLVIPISWLVGKISKVAAMVIGMAISLVGFIGVGATAMGWFVCVMILVFAIGEMTCSPTFSAYVGLIAPPDKKALYMGYSNIPFAIGWAAGGTIGGNLYEALASKFKLARAFLIDHLGMDPGFVHNADQLPNDQVMQTMAHVMQNHDGAAVQAKVQAAWAQVDWKAVPTDHIGDKVGEIYQSAIGTVDHAAVRDATKVLWDLHHPYMVWYYLGAIGLVGTVGMVLFYLFTKGKQGSAAQA